MAFLKKLQSNPLKFFTGVIAPIFITLLLINPSPYSRIHHLLELAQELLALAILVTIFEKYTDSKSELDKSTNIRRAIAWLFSPNTLQIEAKTWIESARGKSGVPNLPMPFHEITNIYHEILILVVQMPDFTEFLQELQSLKDAISVSSKWDQFRATQSGNVIKYSLLLDPILREVENASKRIKDIWLPHEIAAGLGEKYTN